MKRVLIGIALILGMAGAAVAAPAKLKPAGKQSGVRPGLTVKYAYLGPPPAKIQSLSAAKSLVKSGGKPGQPLRGLDYREVGKTAPTLTHPENYNVSADIRGMIKFDAPGVYVIETWSNDGIEATISGKVVGQFDGRQACSANYQYEVEVPKAGWYPLHVYYFQKYGGKCLMMKWGKKGAKLNWVPNSAFGH